MTETDGGAVGLVKISEGVFPNWTMLAEICCEDGGREGGGRIK